MDTSGKTHDALLKIYMKMLPTVSNQWPEKHPGMCAVSFKVIIIRRSHFIRKYDSWQGVETHASPFTSNAGNDANRECFDDYGYMLNKASPIRFFLYSTWVFSVDDDGVFTLTGRLGDGSFSVLVVVEEDEVCIVMVNLGGCEE